MSKRGPIKQMDHNNWDQEDEPEEAGLFNVASQEAMKNRIVKKAKRNVPQAPTAAGAFSGFSGFSSANNSSNSGFQFSNNSPAKSEQLFPKFSLTSNPPLGLGTSAINGATDAANKAKCSKSEEGIGLRQSSTVSMVSISAAPSGSSKSADSLGRHSEYFTKLKTLNTNVAQWISMHVSKNPCCILTPIFRDYERYLQELEKTYPSAGSVASKEVKSEKNLVPTGSDTSVEPKNSIPPSRSEESSRVTTFGIATAGTTKAPAISSWFTSGSGKGDANEKDRPPNVLQLSPKSKEGFSLGMKDSFKSQAATLSFGSSPSSASFKDFKFGFGNSTPAPTTSAPMPATSTFSFAVGSTAVQKSSDPAEEEYVPPQAEVNEIVEEDAFYTKRCKLFYKKDDSFAERGLGLLYLKKLDDKIQLLIRADTSLGNILLNIMVASSMTFQRTGKNNILFCCIPNPPINPKVPSTEPVMMMIRVKTQEDANELLAKMQPTAS